MQSSNSVQSYMYNVIKNIHFPIINTDNNIDIEMSKLIEK